MTLYLSDLDGTLLNYAAKLKPRAAEMLNRFIRKGGVFSYATARRIQTAAPIMKAVSLNIPVITLNGVVLADPETGKSIFTEYISCEILTIAKNFIIQNKETPLVYATVDGMERIAFLKNSNEAVQIFNKSRSGDPSRYACDDYDELFRGEIYYIAMMNTNSKTNALNTVFNADSGFTSVCYSDTYDNRLTFYDIWSAKASKSSAALKLKEITGADRIIVFGDNVNDIPMFEIADECYAVENAVPELKAIATGIISSNEEMGVAVFIEKRTAKIWDYAPPVGSVPNKVRFAAAIQETANVENQGIGTLNEKSIHAALKRYFSETPDLEAKIGTFVADAAGESGIFEIQTADWGKLNKKLDVFLEASHVTVVYPFEERVHIININEQTGGFLKNSVRNNKDLTKFFLELYRIKGFLTHPNLTVCLVGLEIEKFRYINPAKPRKKGLSIKKPLALLSETYLNCGDDYRMFLPQDLPELFTKKNFRNSLIPEILEYMSVIQKRGKKGNELIYSVSPQSFSPPYLRPRNP